MLKLFQIGDAPVHLHQQKWPGWELKSKGKTSDALWSHLNFFPNGQFQPDLQTVKIQSLVLDEYGLTARQQIERLKSLVGLPVPIIAYDLHTSGNMDSCACGSYGIKDMVWYSNAGTLLSISEDASDQYAPISVTLTITFNAYWAPLNRYLWSWQGSDFDPFYPPSINTPYANFILPYPTDFQDFGVMHWSRRPVDRLVAYDPDLWLKQHLNTGLSFETGVGATWGAGDHALHNMDSMEWSAPPLSVYGFKGLTGSSTIEIYVTRKVGLYDTVTDTTVFSPSSTDTRLSAAGLSVLQTTDMIFIGDCYPKPGFIVRNNTILSVAPVVFYSGKWPGQLSPGMNGINFHLSSGVQMAYLHSYRRM